MRKEYARNKLFNFFVILGLIAAGLSVDCFLTNEIGFAIFFCLLALLFLIVPSFLTPVFYAFDSDGVSLHYAFYPTERYLWKDIYAIEVEHRYDGGTASILALFYFVVFTIRGKNVGPCRAYMNGHIRKSIRTKRLLEKYWDGTITGYLFEDTKKRIQQRRNKKQAYVQTHLTDEIVPMEREMRARVREWLTPFAAQAKQQNIELRTKYLYITKDFDELKSRPKEGYTYTLTIEIAHPNETNEEHIYVVSVDLLYVRLGKTAYRGVTNEHAEEELRLTLDEGLKTVSKLSIL